MGKRRKRRSWSDYEKREICQQTTVPGVSVAQVARRYAMNANMIHTWLKDPRFAPETDEPVDDALFLPVELEGEVVHAGVSPDAPSPSPSAPPSAPLSASRIDITGIAKLLVADCEALARVGSCRHFGGVIGPEAERISAGVAV